ncbi:protein of unknown function [Paraburkholderia kururiensis]
MRACGVASPFLRVSTLSIVQGACGSGVTGFGVGGSGVAGVLFYATRSNAMPSAARAAARGPKCDALRFCSRIDDNPDGDAHFARSAQQLRTSRTMKP